MTKPFKFGPRQEAWLRMLETTRRKQCRGHLHDDGGYCCLGIGEISLGKKPSELTFRDVLSAASVRALGLRGNEGQCDSGKGLGNLSYLNDTRRLSFKAIAAVMRANQSVYFTHSN